ncbi:MAG: NBR1-Ig-like domain-containing protein [Anaerolineales bacterium]|jgi:hypothetical protein|nr:NBR1-Ig-like domain-containing protein [Anaerolineales bacterium]
MHKRSLTIFLFLILSLGLVACGAKTEATPTTDPAAVYTAAAETASVRLTQMAAQTPSPLPETATPTLDLTMTAAAQTQSALLTQTTAVGTPTPTATLAVITGTDRSLFVSETVPDGTDFAPNTAFVKTWRLRNSGTSTWTTDYYLVFISGDQMGGPATQRLPVSVAPNAEIDLAVNLVAPAQAGRYRGYWKLMNSAGKLFDDPFYVEIDVISGTSTLATPTATLVSGAPTPTVSSTTITNLTMTVDNASVTGACPQTFNFTATFDLATNALVTYQLEAGSSTPGVTFDLPPAQTVQMSAGKQTLLFSLDFTSSMEAWVRLHITSPVNITSNQAAFKLVCQP